MLLKTWDQNADLAGKLILMLCFHFFVDGSMQFINIPMINKYGIELFYLNHFFMLNMKWYCHGNFQDFLQKINFYLCFRYDRFKVIK